MTTSGGDLNRRTFLKQFALLSSTPLLLQSLSGCSIGAEYGPPPLSEYGPPPVDDTSPQVDGIYIHEPQSGSGVVDNASDVPVNASFEVEFTEAMNPATADSIHLHSDQANQEIEIDVAWLTSRIVLITPVALLEHGMGYTLSVDATASDLEGNPIYLTRESSASFETA
jgi:hypothetical protein